MEGIENRFYRYLELRLDCSSYSTYPNKKFFRKLAIRRYIIKRLKREQIIPRRLLVTHFEDRVLPYAISSLDSKMEDN